MRSRFDEQLEQLNKEMITLAMQCEDSVNRVTNAMFSGNISEIKDMHTTLDQIDRQQREIESLCMHLLLQQQPVARDLRKISSAMKMVTDLERIGDQAADIAEILESQRVRQVLGGNHFQGMAQNVIHMVTEAINAYVRSEIRLAQEVIASDDQVDEAFNAVKEQLIQAMQSSRADSECIIDLLMIAKYYEKIGDHAEQMARWVVFSVSGEYPAKPVKEGIR